MKRCPQVIVNGKQLHKQTTVKYLWVNNSPAHSLSDALAGIVHDVEKIAFFLIRLKRLPTSTPTDRSFCPHPYVVPLVLCISGLPPASYRRFHTQE